MRVADSSALYAAFVAEDHHHERARAELADAEPVVVPREILVETVDLLAFRFGHARGASALDALLELPHVRPAEPVPLEGIVAEHRAAAGKLSLADAVVVQTCRALGASPLTFDREIRTRART